MYFRIVIGGKTLDEVRQAAAQVANRLGEPSVEISTSRLTTMSESAIAKQKAEEQLQEEAAINDMYNQPVDNSVGTVENVTTTAGSNEVSKEVDSKGMPYDERIHSSSKATNKDGSWRYRRNLDEATIAQVEAQLRGTVSAAPVVPSQPALAPPPVFSAAAAEVPVAQPQQFAPTSNFVPQFVQPVAAPQATPVQNVTSVNPAVAPVAAQASAPNYDPIAIPQGIKPAHSFETFKANFLPCMGELSMAQKITPDYISKLCAHFQVNNLWEIEATEGKVRAIYEMFCQHGLITRV